ncbi:MAG: RNA polymerase subunit sigma-70 [Bacteroidales bacterium]|nr:RNA polymerase subunit sigma-70 [Bacteroidales bacterium]
MNKATISADIISFTSLKEKDKRRIEVKVKELILLLTEKYETDSFFGRIVQGDYIECALESPIKSLRIALIFKTYIKSLGLKESGENNKRFKYFKEHAIRLALAVAPLTTLDSEKGIIDGEAIYLSGRAIKSFSTSNKQKIVIKNTLFYYSHNSQEQEKYNTIFSLLDTIIAGCSGKQCEVIYYKLLGYSEKEISQKLDKSQSTISQHSTAAGWQSIEKSVNYFEKDIIQ